jgi:L,D-peptidoglycan transpeptidase YkuD (ErfK/YbiS/YcfS/YnhG family)
MIFVAHGDGHFAAPGWATRCCLGRSGVISAKNKREGDGASPIGVWPIRRVLVRPDRIPDLQTRLDVAPLDPSDGWCDAPQDPAYNRPVRLPYPASAENLWRDDEVYDLIVILGHNDDPPVPGMGSAIFLHLARPDGAPTEGCVALARPDLLRVLAEASPGAAIEIRSV